MTQRNIRAKDTLYWSIINWNVNRPWKFEIKTTKQNKTRCENYNSLQYQSFLHPFWNSLELSDSAVFILLTLLFFSILFILIIYWNYTLNSLYTLNQCDVVIWTFYNLSLMRKFWNQIKYIYSSILATNQCVIHRYGISQTLNI